MKITYACFDDSKELIKIPELSCVLVLIDLLRSCSAKQLHKKIPRSMPWPGKIDSHRLITCIDKSYVKI